jgi:hypothetical protein
MYQDQKIRNQLSELEGKYPKNFGIIFTRHVNSVSTDRYWKETIRCIREHYHTHLIIMIDDNSNPSFLTPFHIENAKSNSSIPSISAHEVGISNEKWCTELENPFSNILYIQSEYPGTGELLPYYYLHKYQFFEHALIIHDSMFLQSPPSLEEIEQIDTVKFLWTIPHWYNYTEDIISMIHFLINPNALIQYYHKEQSNWSGCFGVQSIIHYSFLEKIEEEFGLFELLHQIKTRENRMSLERIFGMLCSILDSNLKKKPSLYGNVCINYINPGYTFDQYLTGKNKNQIPNYPMIKVWTSR